MSYLYGKPSLLVCGRSDVEEVASDDTDESDEEEGEAFSLSSPHNELLRGM